MSIDGIHGSLGGIKPLTPKQLGSGTAQESTAGQASFGEVLKDSLKEVNQLQLTAEDKIESFVLGRGNITPHNAMIALEKADVAFQLMNTIRSRIIRAYEEVMRTQL